MARLPVVGSDTDTWGTVLNQFLQVGHNSGGSLSSTLTVYNVKDDAYGAATGNGVTDDTVAIQAAINTAQATGGGIVYFPPGTYLTTTQTLYSNVYLHGAGMGATTIKLKNGTNADLFNANTANINLSAAAGSGSATGIIGFGFYGLTLDGNKANQSSGPSYCVRVYGYAWMMQDVEITNGFTGGILADWNNTADPATGLTICNHWRDVQIHRNNGIGVQIGGPTDSHWFGVDSFHNGTHNYHLAPNAVGYTITNCHGWSCPTGIRAVTFLCESAGNFFANCQMEGSDTVVVAFLGNDNCYTGGTIFNATTFSGQATAVGLQIGQTAGGTPYTGQIKQSGGLTTAVQAAGTQINTKFTNMQSGAIDYQNEINSDVRAIVWTNGGSVLKSGHIPSYLSHVEHYVYGTASDGGFNTTNMYLFSGPGFNMFRVLASDGTPLLVGDGTDNETSFQNSTHVTGWSDYKVTQSFDLATATGNMALWGSLKVQNAATFYSGNGAPASGTGAIGDYYFRTGTPSTANQRIYIKTATSTWTGIV